LGFHRQGGVERGIVRDPLSRTEKKKKEPGFIDSVENGQRKIPREERS